MDSKFLLWYAIFQNLKHSREPPISSNTNALNVILYDQSQREEMHKRLKNEHLKYSDVPGCHVMFDLLVLCEHQIRTLLFSVKPQEYY